MAKRRKIKRQPDKHEIWQDRPHKARPTPERLRRGRWRLDDTEAAGVTVAVDEQATRLDQLQAKGIITAEQCQAGLDLADLIRRTRVTRAGRSCIDFAPVGHDPDHYDDSAEIAALGFRRQIYERVGPVTWQELWRVCVDERRPSDVDRLRAGLSDCVGFFG